MVGITGSNGKTTLKELIAACLARKAPTLATHGNLNNDIGVPLMLSRIDASHRYAVIEMGANHAGEIAYLVSIADPDIVVITNAGPAHLEGFGSLDGVARAKGEILQNERRPDVAILNADDVYYDYWSSLVEDVRCIRFGLGEQADVRADGIQPHPAGSDFMLHVGGDAVSVSLPLSGVHNVRNACAAAAAAHALGLSSDDIRLGLESVKPVELPIRVAYKVDGISWECDYVALVNDDETSLNLKAEVTIANGTQDKYQDAKIALEVGEPFTRSLESQEPVAYPLFVPLLLAGRNREQHPDHQPRRPVRAQAGLASRPT